MTSPPTSQTTNNSNSNSDSPKRKSPSRPSPMMQEDQSKKVNNNGKSEEDDHAMTVVNNNQEKKSKLVASRNKPVKMSADSEDGHDEEESGATKVDNGTEDEAKFALSSRIDSLQATLDQVRRDTETEISRLRDELIEKNATLERLQVQLREQKDYQDLKRQTELLKSGLPGTVAQDRDDSPGPKEDSLSGSPAPTSLGLGPLPGAPNKGLEMFLYQRARALQQANPALKALVDLQDMSGGNKNWFGDLVKNPMLQSPPLSGISGHLMEEGGLLASLRRNQGAHSFLPPMFGGAANNSAISPSSPGGLMAASKASSLPGVHSTSSPQSPSNRSATPDRRQSPVEVLRTPTTNGGPSPVSDDRQDSPMRLDLKSPFKTEEAAGLPSQAPHPPSLPPHSIHATILSNSNPFISSGGRIPKSDPLEGHLQDMLRYNMEKYAGQALDTLGTSRRVRELLSIHNIGQRLFAKYVLGLSQGTVSELLSKPKCWEKLTEKGRDSYRKMHAWAYDEQAILLLKSLIPRKGELSRTGTPTTNNSRAAVFLPPGIPTNATRDDFPDSAGHAHPAVAAAATAVGLGLPHPMLSVGKSAEESLAKLVSQQQQQQQQPKNNPDVGNRKALFPPLDQKFDAKRLEQSKSPVQRDERSPQQPPELAAASNVRDALQRFGLLSSGLMGGKTAVDEMQRAVDLYQIELAKLQAAVAAKAGEEGAGKDDLKEGIAGSVEDCRPGKVSPGPVTSGPSPFLGGSLPPGFPMDSTSPTAAGEKISASSPSFAVTSSSPLQGMQSITNSLTAQPLHPPYRPPQRSYKAVLPPITQEQFDRYEHINTEELVRKVKETLSQYSISQRLFGENVLGLSQGSVSDLLARPKQYHMLTQKGKEPFIRMKIFLEDEQAVHKLVASQYKIAPDKLMRTWTGNYAGSHGLPNPPALPPTALCPPNRPKLPGSEPLLRPGLEGGVPLGFPGAPGQGGAGLDPLALQRRMNMAALAVSAATSGVGQQQNVYEIAALTQDLDTLQLTTRIRELLSANNICQKLFGEAVLGLSQGSVSELLCKPKPWHMLSIKGREPFIRMQLWLNDPLNIEKLQALKAEQDMNKNSLKRKHDSGSNPGSPTDIDPEGRSADSPPSSGKKARVLFSVRQKEALKLAFSLDPYPSPSAMEFLSLELGLERSSISNWFHNHRMRLKQQPHGIDNLLPKEDSSSRSFDPLHFKLLLNQKLLELEPEDSASSSPVSPPASETKLPLSLDLSPSVRSSRRKPLVPQWVNPAGPAEHDAAGVSKDEVDEERVDDAPEEADDKQRVFPGDLKESRSPIALQEQD